MCVFEAVTVHLLWGHSVRRAAEAGRGDWKGGDHNGPGSPSPHYLGLVSKVLLMGTTYLIPFPLCSWLAAHFSDLFQRIILGYASLHTAELECLRVDGHFLGHRQPIYYSRKAQLLALRQYKLRGAIYTVELPGIKPWPGLKCMLAWLFLLSPVSLASLLVSVKTSFTMHLHLDTCLRLCFWENLA